jgi:F0F1-type ATP synthase assembly protein I
MPKRAARKATRKKADDRMKKAAGIFIPAGIFLGMGIGWIFDYLVQGLFIGLGAGFLGLAIVTFMGRK